MSPGSLEFPGTHCSCVVPEGGRLCREVSERVDGRECKLHNTTFTTVHSHASMALHSTTHKRTRLCDKHEQTKSRPLGNHCCCTDRSFTCTHCYTRTWLCGASEQCRTKLPTSAAFHITVGREEVAHGLRAIDVTIGPTRCCLLHKPSAGGVCVAPLAALVDRQAAPPACKDGELHGDIWTCSAVRVEVQTDTHVRALSETRGHMEWQQCWPR